VNIIFALIPILVVVCILLIGNWMWQRKQNRPREISDEDSIYNEVRALMRKKNITAKEAREILAKRNTNDVQGCCEKTESKALMFILSSCFCMVIFVGLILIGVYVGNWLPLLFIGGGLIIVALIGTKIMDAILGVLMLVGLIVFWFVSRGCWSQSALPW